MTEILDTNVLVRFFTGDVPSYKEQAVKWFAEAETGKRQIRVISLVIAETAFVLESYYKQARQNVAEGLGVFISQRWLQIQERDVLQRALVFYREGEHFVDSYILALSQIENMGILTFDQKLKKKANKASSDSDNFLPDSKPQRKKIL